MTIILEGGERETLQKRASLSVGSVEGSWVSPPLQNYSSGKENLEESGARGGVSDTSGFLGNLTLTQEISDKRQQPVE